MVRASAKNSAARMPVVRLRKFAEPAAPNTVPEAPLPKAAPASAPLPCCSRIRAMRRIASNTRAMVRIVYNMGDDSMIGVSVSGGTDGQELRCIQRGATHQSAVDIRHAEQLRRVGRLDAAAVQEARGGGYFSILRREQASYEGMDFLGLIGLRGAAGAD